MFCSIRVFIICFGLVGGALAIDCKQYLKPELIPNCCNTWAPFRESEQKCNAQYPVEQMQMHSCLGECILNATGLAANNDIPKDKIASTMEELYKSMPEFVSTAQTKMTNCYTYAKANVGKVREKHPEMIGNCNPEFVIMLACYTMDNFKNCPSSSWVNTEECNNAKEFVKACASHQPK